MRYAQIRNIDISNGSNIGVALFVQGCSFHCLNCFNSKTWDFNGGQKWDEVTKKTFIQLIDKPYIKRISILGGEPLSKVNLSEIYSLIKEIKERFPNKSIWLYSGYTYEEIFNNNTEDMLLRQNILKLCDVFVDGRYEDDKRDISLQFRGSSNQRLINMQETLKGGKVILWG